MIPEFTSTGDLPVGIHRTTWAEFQSRFGISSPRRVWLISRLEQLLELAGRTGKLKRVFVWGSFVSAKPAPNDIDLLLIMQDDFDSEKAGPASRPLFDSTQAKLLFACDVFWARASIGDGVLTLWLETYQITRAFGKRGIVELELL